MTHPSSHAVDAYLKQLQKAFAQGDATEHTHRAALKQLLEASATKITATNEPKAVERENKPDYIVRRGSSIIGFVEAKDIDADLKKALKTPQLKRYLEALPNLLLTNYTDFIWFVGGEKRMEISLAAVNGKAITPAPDAAQKWAELVSSFLAVVTPTLTTPSQVAKNLAGQTRLLRDLSKELLEANNPDLLSQEASFRALLVPDLKSEEFADMYAQTAAYGLFTARVFEHTTLFGGPAVALPSSMNNQDFSLEKAAYLIPKANPFLRQFFQHVASPELNPQLRWLIEQIADSLRFVDMDKVLHRQGKKQGFEDPVFHFYERFLAEYDPALRKSRGVYYTPEPVVDYIVRGVDELLQTRFNKPRGLADPSALILDPATGTATFLRKVIDVIYKREIKDGAGGSWPDYVRSKLLPRVFGFELMMAPYTVAHLKLALQLQEQGFQFAHGERLNVFLTNTLDTIKTQVDAYMANWIASENEGAEHVKRAAPVEVVLGNPPYSGESRNKSDFIMNLLASYKKEPEGGPLKERNSKWLNDDYVKFIRFAHDRVARTGHGIVAFITNHGWIDNPTFRGMRAQLMADFDDIYVIDLHGNSKKRERTPEALKAFGEDKNVFDIEQGVSNTFLVKLPASTAAPAGAEEAFSLVAQDASEIKPKARKLAGGAVTLRARIHHAQLWGGREHKYEWLEANSIASTPWQTIQPPLPQLLMTPRDESSAEEYGRGWSVTDIYGLSGTGVITKCDQLNISFSSGECMEKVKWFANATEADARSRLRLPKEGVRDWTFAGAVTDLKVSGLSQSLVKPILYRPFDTRFTYYTAKSRGVMGWPVEKLFRHFDGHENLALVTSRLTKGEQFAHVQITDKLTEVICMSGQTSNNGFIFPLWVLPITQSKSTNAKTARSSNISISFVNALESQIALAPTQPSSSAITAPHDVLAYLYAVLHAPSYRSRYAEFLRSDFPRIPIALDAAAPAGSTFADVWTKLLPLGQKMIDLHLLRNVPSELRASFNVSGSSEVEKPRYEPPNTPMNPGKLGRVYINASQCFEGVTPETWAFKVGGYQVCEKWLKDRKGRTLTSDDVDHYRNVVAALTRTQTLMQEIDAVVNGVLWPT